MLVVGRFVFLNILIFDILADIVANVFMMCGVVGNGNSAVLFFAGGAAVTAVGGVVLFKSFSESSYAVSEHQYAYDDKHYYAQNNVGDHIQYIAERYHAEQQQYEQRDKYVVTGSGSHNQHFLRFRQSLQNSLCVHNNFAKIRFLGDKLSSAAANCRNKHTCIAKNTGQAAERLKKFFW